MGAFRESFFWLLRSKWYNFVFYLLTAGTLSCAAAFLHFHGVSDKSILAGGLILVLPMHLVTYLAYRFFWFVVPKIAGRYIRVLLSVTRKTVLTELGQRQILLGASYAALVTLVVVLGAASSAVVTALLADAAKVSPFPVRLYLLIISTETAFLLLVGAVPLVMRYFWLLALGSQGELKYYEARSCQAAYPMLRTAAAGRGIHIFEAGSIR